MTEKTFSRTEVVYLKSGGPGMTVANVIPNTKPELADRGDVVECTWFEGKKLRKQSFFADLLRHTDPKIPNDSSGGANVPMPNETAADRS